MTEPSSLSHLTRMDLNEDEKKAARRPQVET